MNGTRRRTRTPGGLVAIALLLATALVAAGCTSGNETAGTGVSSSPPQSGGAAAPNDGSGQRSLAPAPAQSTDVAATTPVEKLVVVTKTMRLEVEDVTAILDKVRAMTKAAGGDITALQVSTSGGEPIYSQAGSDYGASSGSAPLQASATIRVPSKNYADFIDKAAKLGRVTFQSENTEDVTQQHVDMTARLRNLKAEEVRFRQFLKQARNVREALEVERELERVRGEIESLQAQIDYLEKQAAMATVTLELTEPTPIVSPGGTDWGIRDAITTGIRGLVGLINIIIVVVIATAPIWIPGLLIGWLVIVLIRRRRAKAAAQMPQSPADADAADNSSDAEDAPTEPGFDDR